MTHYEEPIAHRLALFCEQTHVYLTIPYPMEESVNDGLYC